MYSMAYFLWNRWPVDENVLISRIQTLNVFTDNELNELVKTILMRPDSLAYMSRSVAHLFFVFFSAENFRHGYMPRRYVLEYS